MQATRKRFADGRWHLQHGPIDLMVSASGAAEAVAAAHEACWLAFQGVLSHLVEELPQLRQALTAQGAHRFEGPVATRMAAATLPFCAQFITPMAAVAGAVADQLIGCFDLAGVERAAINNGGDIALHLRANQHFDVAIGRVGQLGRSLGSFRIEAADLSRGVASSGWQGRSFSLGIADSVTVLASSAAAADAAATMIANEVNIEHPAIVRMKANACKDDSDLGELLVTRGVPVLSEFDVDEALSAGARYALELYQRGLIHATAMFLQGQMRQIGARQQHLEEGLFVPSETALEVMSP